MNFFNLFGIFAILIFGSLFVNSANAQIDPLTDISFLQTGELVTSKNQFQISNDLIIREFFSGKIIRVSGQTIEGFPYITYSKISNDEINTHGVIFIQGKFINLLFVEKFIEGNKENEKSNDLSVLTQYTQRVYSKQFVKIDIKIFDKEQNKLNDFNQNYGYVPNTNVDLVITNVDSQRIFSSNGTTNDKGFFETQYLIPENSKRETLSIKINAENENSASSKILQIFILGEIPSDGKSS